MADFLKVELKFELIEPNFFFGLGLTALSPLTTLKEKKERENDLTLITHVPCPYENCTAIAITLSSLPSCELTVTTLSGCQETGRFRLARKT